MICDKVTIYKYLSCTILTSSSHAGHWESVLILHHRILPVCTCPILNQRHVVGGLLMLSLQPFDEQHSSHQLLQPLGHRLREVATHGFVLPRQLLHRQAISSKHETPAHDRLGTRVGDAPARGGAEKLFLFAGHESLCLWIRLCSLLGHLVQTLGKFTISSCRLGLELRLVEHCGDLVQVSFGEDAIWVKLDVLARPLLRP
mmetsp:Transcript_18650/g.42620  ORF Transcript_18650/g.42620 Transcript_18650/m.42620 type:complete len:201 (-) Transcript_18650:12944-13546(-)